MVLIREVTIMRIYVYIKNTENVSEFIQVLNIIRQDNSEIVVITESRRSFRELEKIKNIVTINDIVVVFTISSLGLNEAEISNQLDWFATKSICLVICDLDSTYRFGVTQPMNKAVLTTLLQSVLRHNSNIVKLPVNRRKNSGRNKIAYPDNWEELYESWIDKQITSKEFLNKTGLKKATFYNLLTDYKQILKELEAFQFQYKLS